MAITPRLIAPSAVVVEQVNKAATTFDANAREPVRSVARTSAVTLRAQVSWSSNRRLAFKAGGQGGVNTEATGYLVFLRRDLAAAGVTLAEGDKVSSIAGISCDPPVYLTGLQNAGHHDGTSHLVIWDFAGKRPGA